MRRFRSLSIVVSAIAVSALVGGFFGKSLLADDKVPDHYKAFTAALSAIESGYIDKIDSDRLVYGAVRGMLSTLDPHSSFFDPREYAQMRERQEGHYYGIGIQISAVDGDIIAQFVFEGSPAYKQGVRQGDVIANIAGEGTKGWNTDQAMKKLRGARGTPVQISLRRRGYAQVINVELVRDEITIPTVPAFFMIDATTGYVQLRDFGENTDRDLRRALQALAPKGMRRLLLDIRNNPGGPLDQAIKVVNEFMPRGKMIVYTRGRVSNSDQDYRATEEGQFTDIPIVVMANRSSASASEIVTGPCRITTARTSSAKRRSARRSCSPSTASAAARASHSPRRTTTPRAGGSSSGRGTPASTSTSRTRCATRTRTRRTTRAI